ncbi:MAG: hypothetical protein K1X53_04625 [Candidatus Sumerlaeaceae bacterium]|nr:hypothetical protein [Candidatus Sumerlaeaceae bacterium]
MSDLSEAAYCAGWMLGLEFALWRAITEGPQLYGRLAISAQHISQLQALSDDCGGWIVFDDEKEETFMSLDEWRTFYAVHITRMERYT